MPSDLYFHTRENIPLFSLTKNYMDSNLSFEFAYCSGSFLKIKISNLLLNIREIEFRIR